METSSRLLGLVLLTGTAAAQMPPVPTPIENPTTPAKVLLGKMLFWDEQLSSDDTVACGTCHLPAQGGSDPRTPTSVHPGADGLFGTEDDVLGSPGIVSQSQAGDFQRAGSFGIARQVTGRTSPSNIGAAHHDSLFWDGRASGRFVDPETAGVVIKNGGALESQAIGPILNSVEMGQDGRTWSDVRGKLMGVRPLRLASNLPPDVAAALQNGATYPSLFAAAFGDPTITAVRIGFALASYQRTLVADQTPFDLWQQGSLGALTANQVLGMNLFFGVASCAVCHPAPLFTDDQFHNLGLRPASEDMGRQGHTGLIADHGKFKTPTLRNAGLRPRLFHNGQSPALGSPDQISDVRSVANVYLRGGGADRSAIDPQLLPLTTMGLNLQDLARVLDFVEHGLTDPRVAAALPPFDHPTLRTQALAAPLRFGPSLAGASTPDFAATVPTWLGNPTWKLGLSGGDGTTPGFLVWSFTARLPAEVFGGIPVNIGPDSDWAPFLLQGPPGAPGLATWKQPIPDAAVLLGLTAYFQLFTIDAVAPTGIGASSGLRLVVQ